MAKAKRKQVEQQEQVQQDAATALQAAVEAKRQAAPVQPIQGPIMVTVSLDGKTVDVASQPLVTGEQMLRTGRTLAGLCYNIMNGVLSPEVRDVTGDNWKGVSDPDKNAFRNLRNILDGSEKLPKAIYDKVKDKTLPERAAFIRNSWAAYVAEQAKKKADAEAEGKRAPIRLRDVTLQALWKLFKGQGNRPQGGGIPGLKENVLKELQAVEKALNSKNWGALKKHLAAAMAYVRPKSESEEAKPEAK